VSLVENGMPGVWVIDGNPSLRVHKLRRRSAGASA
jgi:hypothetical protein